VLAALEAGRFVLVTSEPLLDELGEVLSRPRILRRYPLAPDAATALGSRLRRRAEIVRVQYAVHLCRDPDDNLVIETAALGRAELLVTRDDDLKGDLSLSQALAAGGIAVLSVRRFLAVLEDKPGY
jgi:putative PIN family toxin of toxin-antitoxin system